MGIARFSNRGLAYKAKGDLDHAIADHSKAIELAPQRPSTTTAASITKAKGDLDHAIAEYSKAIELASKLAIPYSNRGYAYKAKGDLGRAIADYKAIEIDPRDAISCGNRGNAYKAKGDLGRAIADYNRAIEIEPKNAKSACAPN